MASSGKFCPYVYTLRVRVCNFVPFWLTICDFPEDQWKQKISPNVAELDSNRLRLKVSFRLYKNEWESVSLQG